MNDNNNNCQLSDCSKMQGIIALVFGVSLLIVSGHVALQILLFIAGILLLNHGFRVLKITQITSMIDFIIEKIQALLRRF